VSEAKRAFIPTIAVDFDGCIHSYERGWQGGKLYGTVVPGFFEWAMAAGERFHLVIHSSRAARGASYVQEMRDWLQEHYNRWRANQQHPTNYPLHLGIEIVAEKPPAWLTIDDRCVRFDGHWDEFALRPETMLGFRPWMTRMEQGGGDAT